MKNRKRIYFSTIDGDVRKVLGKKLYKKCEEENGGWVVAERSNGDAEYHLIPDACVKLKNHMLRHKNSRLNKAWVDSSGFNIRFEIDSWM